MNPSRRNIRTHGIWIYDALLNQGFVIVLYKQPDIFTKFLLTEIIMTIICQNYVIEFIIKKSTFTEYDIVR